MGFLVIIYLQLFLLNLLQYTVLNAILCTMKQSTLHQPTKIVDDFKPIWTFDIEMEADLACFSHHLQKVERGTYPMPTATAIVKAVSSVYWHPPLRYRVDGYSGDIHR